MTQQTFTPAHPALSEIDINYGQIRRDMLVRRIGKILFYANPLFSYFFLWAPIVVLVVLSFNKSDTVSVWGGFTTNWYARIFDGTSQFTVQMFAALRNTLFIAVCSTLISTIIGTMVSIALERGVFPGKKIVDAVLYLPVVIPEITQAVSLAVFFKFLFDTIEGISGQRATLGFGTIIIGHVVFSVSFVVITIRGRLADMNPRYEEAARDLGANEWQTFWRVTFPLILPGIISGALLAFTLSLDDYIVTFFTNGVGTNTLPIFVYGLLRQRVSPEINAISTILLVASMVLVGISLYIQGRGANR
ncbi:MAG: ABC transporter permease [Chloroflexi bacterium]|nr:ABC transporter permease [Chloroflexota bacterium]